MWRLGLLAMLAWAAQTASGQTRPLKQWELQGGAYWEPAAQAVAAQAAPDPVLDHVEAMLRDHQTAAAKKLVLQWLGAHKVKQPPKPKEENTGLFEEHKVHEEPAPRDDTPNRDKAVYLLGQANFELGDRFQSFFNFDEVLDLYPDSRFCTPALERQYDIADAYLNGYKNRFLGLPILNEDDEAVEMLYRIQERRPGSALAEKALLRTADYYYKDTDYDLAADAYRVFSRSYPRSPQAPRARLLEAFSNIALFHGLRFDASQLIDAREELTAVARQYPELAERENLAAVIQRMDETFARKLLVQADYYRRTHAPESAVYLLRYVIQSYPDTPAADEARAALARAPAWALGGAPPPAGQGFAPTTVPAIREPVQRQEP